jgi:hypothetical protein
VVGYLADMPRTKIVFRYLAGWVLVVLGLPLFLGYLGAIILLVIGIALLVRTRRLQRRWL